MKKTIMMLMAVIMIAILASCGTKNDSISTAASTNADQQSATQRQEIQEQSKETQEPQNTATEPPTVELETDFSATIEETVLVDDMGIKITATELTYNSYQAQLSVTLENNSDKDLTFLAGTAGYPLNSVNGYMVTGGYLNEDVAAGMTATEKMNFSLDELTLFGLKDIAEIGVGFNIQEGYDDYYQSGPVFVKTTADASYDYEADTFSEIMGKGVLTTLYDMSLDYVSNEVIFDGSGVSILNQYVGTNKDGECIMFMEVKNDSETDVYVSMSDIKINNIVVSSGTWDTDYIVAGKRAVMSIDLNNAFEPEYMEALGMDGYNNVAFKFSISPGDDYYNEIASSDIIIDFGDAELSEYSGDILYSENNIVIISAGLAEDPYDYSNDIHALFVVKNENTFEITIDDSDGAYVDKTKIDYTCYSMEIQSGETAILDVELDGDDFEDNDFELSNVSEITMIFEIKNDSYDTIGEPSVTMLLSK